MIYTYEYETAYHGPALPVVEIEVGAAGESPRRLVLRALVDSGADGTMIPVRYLHQVQAKVVDRRQMRSSAKKHSTRNDGSHGRLEQQINQTTVDIQKQPKSFHSHLQLEQLGPSIAAFRFSNTIHICTQSPI